ncbi:restriction endonuclease subunit S [Enhydrobacter sp.]|jgi:type I restriction enzyme S subunit|uniref:restriction endonuclease subunit S n=1 Tax=Enhydrobacter sp. TaxID=1894999 RepID=UPI002611AFBE|nr:restriction endonuclease subunit S [Enhydrobacter sp.]
MLGEVLRQDTQYVHDLEPRAYPKLSVKLYGRGVVLDAPADGGSVKMEKHQLARSGQVILSEIWAKKGAIGIVPPEGDGALCTSHFFLFDIDGRKAFPGFIAWLLRGNYFEPQLNAEARGTTGYAAIRPKQFLATSIPLPSLDEQRRIVARIEELAAKVKEASKLRAESARASQALSASILDRLLPKSAPEMPLRELVMPGTSISYGVLVPGADTENGVPFVRVQDLSVKSPLSMPNKRISKDIAAQYKRTTLQGGEVLIGVVGSIGKIGMAPQSWAGANIARAVCRVLPRQDVDARFLAESLSDRRCQDYFREQTRTLAQPTLNVGQLENTPIKLPSLDEQRRIVAELDALQTKVDTVRALQTETATELDAVLPAILDKAFKGGL